MIKHNVEAFIGDQKELYKASVLLSTFFANNDNVDDNDVDRARPAIICATVTQTQIQLLSFDRPDADVIQSRPRNSCFIWDLIVVDVQLKLYTFIDHLHKSSIYSFSVVYNYTVIVWGIKETWNQPVNITPEILNNPQESRLGTEGGGLLSYVLVFRGRLGLDPWMQGGRTSERHPYYPVI